MERRRENFQASGSRQYRGEEEDGKRRALENRRGDFNIPEGQRERGTTIHKGINTFRSEIDWEGEGTRTMEARKRSREKHRYPITEAATNLAFVSGIAKKAITKQIATILLFVFDARNWVTLRRNVHPQRQHLCTRMAMDSQDRGCTVSKSQDTSSTKPMSTKV